ETGRTDYDFGFARTSIRESAGDLRRPLARPRGERFAEVARDSRVQENRNHRGRARRDAAKFSNRSGLGGEVKKITVEISDSLFRKVKATAAQRGLTMNQFVAETLREKL